MTAIFNELLPLLINHGVHFIGDLDLLGEVTGGGTYAELLPFSENLSVFGVQCRFVTR
jgi:hypothetical protein